MAHSSLTTTVLVSLATVFASRFPPHKLVPLPRPNPPTVQKYYRQIAPNSLLASIHLYSLAAGIPPALTRAVAFTESTMRPWVTAENPHLESKYGKLGSRSYGLMQVNAQWVGTRMCPEAHHPADLLDLDLNLLCGTRILKSALQSARYDTAKALSIFHSGKPTSKAGQKYAQKVMANLG